MMLTQKQTEKIKEVDRYIQERFSADKSGHDYEHIKRVVGITARFAERENAYRTLLVAYFHDLLDDKLFDVADDRVYFAEVWNHLGLETDLMDDVYRDIKSIGYKGGYIQFERSEYAQIVSDADYLDAMGAVGIARTFYYAGFKGLPFHKTELEGLIASDYQTYRNQERNAIAHFDEKLLKLESLIVTEAGKKMAHERHQIMERFYHEFYEEIHEADSILEELLDNEHT